MKTYKELIVWKKLNLFPSDENFGLKSQIRRCSVSIPSSIDEGFGKNSMKDFIRFLRISMRSLFEFLIKTTFNLEYINKEAFEKNDKNSRYCRV
jgi:four helix bundle protein